MISRKEVQHIAKLARLGITKEEEEKFAKELSPILDYIEKLKEVNVSKVEATSHPLRLENVMREDKGKSGTKAKELIDMAPDRKDRYIKVKPILK